MHDYLEKVTGSSTKIFSLSYVPPRSRTQTCNIRDIFIGFVYCCYSCIQFRFSPCTYFLVSCKLGSTISKCFFPKFSAQTNKCTSRSFLTSLTKYSIIFPSTNFLQITSNKMKTAESVYEMTLLKKGISVRMQRRVWVQLLVLSSFSWGWHDHEAPCQGKSCQFLTYELNKSK